MKSTARAKQQTPAPRRRKPRAFREWAALRRWKQLPPWEEDPPGYLLRLARERAGLTQGRLGLILRVSQQAIAQAERPSANLSVRFMRAWLSACDTTLLLALRPTKPNR